MEQHSITIDYPYRELTIIISTAKNKAINNPIKEKKRSISSTIIIVSNRILMLLLRILIVKFSLYEVSSFLSIYSHRSWKVYSNCWKSSLFNLKHQNGSHFSANVETCLAKVWNVKGL
jgi:hypothetical protein